MKMEILALIAGLLWCGVGPARADLTASQFRNSKATSEETNYLEGLMDVIEITNALAQTGHLVFCTEGRFTPVEEFREFLDKYIQTNASVDKENIASVATSALMAAYPCSGR
ncbi:MAG: hypothetical protein EPN45_23625 [Rhizobiaceae bacterium]|nr:MAG: hypothetical protein EPN45_23625 [Rhizobiaceae bacterium]